MIMQTELSDEQLDALLEEITASSISGQPRRTAAKTVYQKVRQLRRSGLSEAEIDRALDDALAQAMFEDNWGEDE
jgi:hypothetical protein